MLARNDIRQYDELANAWWDRNGPFATLHWMAQARSQLIPVAKQPGAVLLDLACGAGLLAPHLKGKNYCHIGIDLTASALTQAAARQVRVIQGDVTRLPFADHCADVVCAGEILEHVGDVDAVVAESCRVLKPGGLVVLDTIANTRLARLVAVELAERIPGGAPPGIHDPELFVDREALVASYRRHGVQLELRGLRPSIRPWRRNWRAQGRMIPFPLTSVLFQGWGRKGAP